MEFIVSVLCNYFGCVQWVLTQCILCHSLKKKCHFCRFHKSEDYLFIQAGVFVHSRSESGCSSSLVSPVHSERVWEQSYVRSFVGTVPTIVCIILYSVATGMDAQKQAISPFHKQLCLFGGKSTVFTSSFFK